MNEDPKEVRLAPPKPERFLGWWEWCAFLLVSLISLGLYVYSQAPSVTLEDSGELATAGANLGVPHPPGYPLWTILVWLFSKALWFVQYRGHPNPAWTIAFASAVFGALTSGLIAMLICRSGRDMLEQIRKRVGSTDAAADNVICWAGAVSATLLFSFCMSMWTQCNIVEVYSLNALITAIILLLGYAWMHRPSDKFLYGIALAFGLGMGDWYPSVMLVSLGGIILIMIRDIKLFRDFCAVGLVLLGIILLNIKLSDVVAIARPDGSQAYPWAGTLLWSQGPYSVAFWAYLTINCGVIAIGGLLLPRGKTVATCFILAELGLLIYLYMPLVSDLHNPPMNWAYPRTWEGLIHAVTRGQYEKVTPGPIFDPMFIDQMTWYGDCLRAQFTIPLCLVALFSFAGWNIKVGTKRLSMLLPGGIAVALSTILLFAGKISGPGSLTISGNWDYNDPFVLILVLLGVTGLIAMVFGQIKELAGKMTKGSDANAMDKVLIALILTAGLLVLLAYEWNAIALLTSSSPLSVDGKLVVVVFLILAPVILTGFVAWLVYGPAQLRFDFDEITQKWLLVTLVAYGFMSIFMVVLSNLKGDVQDLFIQKIKFITSYEVFSLWIGYGLILGLAFVRRLLSGNRLIANIGTWSLTACVLLLPLYPVLTNAPFPPFEYDPSGHDKSLFKKFNQEIMNDEGGANARNSDYGWQFGNYQLRGAEAIFEELKPGEPPPPNRNYPPPMGTNAIFFGGTDPGRFVPTYMIYSAHVREDVSLITQNALADHTYMSVMRDLYGDRIWIPALVDNQQAFAIFADEVKRGVRSGNVDVQGGKVVVQGVDQVMAINGILCKMIHDHNKWKHPFYVEESYVIPWMYQYMEPHGLIMKINPEPLARIPDETVKNDMAFWNWYSHRMLNDENFTTDAVARKTFSKLRSAIAGLYESRGMWNEAEKSYLEAVSLCPVSPEAAFRLASMYMGRGKMEEARKVMVDYGKLDPHNPRPMEMIRQIDLRLQMMKRKTTLEKELSSGGSTIQSVVELAQIYRAIGNTQGYLQLAKTIVDNPNVPIEAQMLVLKWHQDDKRVDELDKAAKKVLARTDSNAPPAIRPKIYKEIAGMYASVNKLSEAGDSMRKYLALVPLDFVAWHELGVMYAYSNRNEEANQAFLQAIKIAGDRAREEYRKDSRMDPFRNLPVFKHLSDGV